MLEKLAALVPAPKAHLVRYAGVLAPAAKWRALIVPGHSSLSVEDSVLHSGCEKSGWGTEPPLAPSLANSEPKPAAVLQPSAAQHGRNYSWADLMKRVWALDVLECPRCQGRMRIVAAIHPPDATRKILNCLGLPSRTPPVMYWRQTYLEPNASSLGPGYINTLPSHYQHSSILHLSYDRQAFPAGTYATVPCQPGVLE